jgi:hypothetical protein
MTFLNSVNQSTYNTELLSEMAACTQFRRLSSQAWFWGEFITYTTPSLGLKL